jgi:hypothetical protein
MNPSRSFTRVIRSAAALGLLLAVGAAGPSGALGCSGAQVPEDEIRREAERIVVGTIVARKGDPGAPDAIALRVDGVIRGVTPAQLVLQPPTYMGCDGRIAEPVGTRIVVATAPQYFDAAPPEELHPYWIVLPDGTVDPVGLETDQPPGRTLDDLAASLGGSVTAIDAAASTDDGSPDSMIVGAVTALVVGAAVVLGAAAVARRRE